MGRKITKLRAAKMERDLHKLDVLRRKLHSDAKEFSLNAKGGDYTVLVPLVKALKEAGESVKESKAALEAVQQRKDW